MGGCCWYCGGQLGPGEAESHAMCRDELERREREGLCEKCGGERMSQYGKWCKTCYMSATALYRNFPERK